MIQTAILFQHARPVFNNKPGEFLINSPNVHARNLTRLEAKMGVTLDLRLIDHEHIVLGGTRAVNDAIRKKEPNILYEYLVSLPVEVDPAIVDRYTQRLARLREFKAPAIIIQNEERFLDLAKGAPYQPERLQEATFDQLRELLGTWCWINHTYSLDKTWQDLHWFLEPVAGSIHATSPQYPEVGDSAQSIWTKCMKGSIPYPKDELGDPIIRTLGSNEPGCTGYAPPDVCKEALAALQKVDPENWTEHFAFRRELYKKGTPGLSDEDIDVCIESELTFAMDAFPVLLAAYTKAVERGFGVSCEYSL
jgi:hypothetical protein